MASIDPAHVEPFELPYREDSVYYVSCWRLAGGLTHEVLDAVGSYVSGSGIDICGKADGEIADAIWPIGSKPMVLS
jgi:hypothetical protein